MSDHMPLVAFREGLPKPEANMIDHQTEACLHFADPYYAWRRGCNKNTEKLVR
jgi:IS30 family transposase